MFGSGISLAVSLAVVALGYWVCAKATKEVGFLKALGAILGLVIIVIGLFSSFFIFFSQAYLAQGICRAKVVQVMPQTQPKNTPTTKTSQQKTK